MIINCIIGINKELDVTWYGMDIAKIHINIVKHGSQLSPSLEMILKIALAFLINIYYNNANF